MYYHVFKNEQWLSYNWEMLTWLDCNAFESRSTISVYFQELSIILISGMYFVVRQSIDNTIFIIILIYLLIYFYYECYFCSNFHYIFIFLLSYILHNLFIFCISVKKRVFSYLTFLTHYKHLSIFVLFPSSLFWEVYPL